MGGILIKSYVRLRSRLIKIENKRSYKAPNKIEKKKKN